MLGVNPAIEYRDVIVRAPSGATILDGVSLRVDAGERVAFLGRSGAGKTTALRVINGMVAPSSGKVFVIVEDRQSCLSGPSLSGPGLSGQAGLPDLHLMRRRIGYVMQHPALFPHRTVLENVATVPRLLGWPDDRVRAEATRLLQQLELPLETFGARYPRTLSGGQQQRVAIARALIASPEILLCDEPFSALDPLIRAELQLLLRNAASSTTLIFVTHDVREALRIAERVVLFDAGRIVADVPASAFPSHDHPLVRRFVEA